MRTTRKIQIHPDQAKRDADGFLSDKGTCEICGEGYNMMSTRDSFLAGEWWIKDDDRFPDDRPNSIIAHPDCAIPLNLPMA